MTELRFKDYIWKTAPDSLHVEQDRNVKRIGLPFSGEILQDCGAGKRIITGKGRFLGRDCLNEFNRLAAVFGEKEGGTFCMPGVPPFRALPLSITLLGEAEPNCVHYTFSLAEDETPVPDDGVIQETAHICEEGESLWTLAARFGLDMDSLLEKNPWIKWPDELDAGKELVF